MTKMLTIDQPNGFTNHKAGWIDFGQDGDLYIATGDGGGGGDPDSNGQNINTLLGKMLRIDVSGRRLSRATRIATTRSRPTILSSATTGADEIWASGLRNPFRDGFDRGARHAVSSPMSARTNGKRSISGQSGANYGWNIFEGPERFSPGRRPRAR